MKRTKMSLWMLIIIIMISSFGIYISTVMIDKCIEQNKNITEVNANIDVNVKVYNNCSDKVIVDAEEDENGDISVIVSDRNIEEVEHKINEDSLYPIDGIVDTELGLNIREGAGIDTNKVGVYCYGDKVKIIGEEGNWYITEKGYVCKDYVRII